MAAIFSLSLTSPSINPELTAIAALFIAFFSASQDIVIDAYRTEYLDTDQYGEGAAVAVFGYRLGMLVAGAGALYFADNIGWQMSYQIMSLAVIVGIITILLSPEPNSNYIEKKFNSIADWWLNAFIEPFHNFMIMHKKWWVLLLFVALYRMSDGFIGFMATPFMLDIGFSKTDIAAIAKLYGFGATIIGMFIGGALLHKIGLYKSLFWFGAFQLVTNLTYILLSYVGTEIWALSLAITCDNLAGGMITAAAIAFMMSLCNKDYTATQYALLASLASLASILMSGGCWLGSGRIWLDSNVCLIGNTRATITYFAIFST